MTEHWSTEDDVQAYAQFVAGRVFTALDRASRTVLPELIRTTGATVTALTDLAAAFRQSEIREVAEHPDLAELDAQLRGFYGDAR